MASFSSFKNLDSALIHFNVTETSKNIFKNIAIVHVPQTLQSEIEFNITEMPYNVSESSICEMVIFPILKSLWTNFKAKLLLWSHKGIGKEADLMGIPDYIIAKRSPLGRVMDLPMLVMIEAKKDDFDGGWGQCLAQMISAQKLNQSDSCIYGIVTNGDTWQFGNLVNQSFTKNTFPIGINEMDKLYSALYFIFAECEKQIK